MQEQQTKDRSKKIQKSLNLPYFFIFPTIIGLAIAGIVFSIYQSKYDILNTNEKIQILAVISDCFFVSGVFVGGVGLLVLISGEGFFDMLVYGVSNMMSYIFIPKEKRYHESYIDYKLRKEAEREGGRIWFIAAVGGVFLLVALFTAIPFFNVSQKKLDKGFETAKVAVMENIGVTADDFSVTTCDYVYVKFYKDHAVLNGTLWFKISFESSVTNSTRYVCYYIDADEAVITNATGYHDIHEAYRDGSMSGTEANYITKE